MQYAQLTPDGSYSHQITTSGNVEWDEHHFCPASTLTEYEAAMFRVVSLLETEKPTFDPITQSCQRDGAEMVNSQWQFKWKVVKLGTEAIAANQAAKAADDCESAKAARDAAVDAITVTVSTGKVFDGNDSAIANLMTAIQIAQISGQTETEWTLADNSRVSVTLAEISEALVMAGMRKSALWALQI